MPAGSGGILKQTAQMKGGAFTGKYKPSFAALALNITAKTAPKRTFGFEIRPIVTGKPKHQENKKLTGNYINLDDKRKTINLGRKK